MDPGVLLLSIAGGGGSAAVITGLFGLLSKPMAMRNEVGAIRMDLVKCQGDCIECKERLARAELRADVSDARALRLEEDIKYWRRQYEREHPRPGGDQGD